MKQLMIAILVGCSIENQLSAIRPGASYIIHSGDYAGIEWTDKLQAKPTPAEMDQALTSCQATIKSQTDPVDQAKVDALNVSKTPDQRIDAINKILGLR